MTRRTSVLMAAMAAVAMLGAACGDDGGGEKATSSATTAASSSGATATSGSGSGATGVATSNCKLDRPVKLIGLGEKPPEAPAAIPDYDNAWNMAVDGLTICGQKVQYERIPLSTTDSAAAKTQLLSALDKKPDVMFGIGSSAIFLALAADVKAGGTPTIVYSAGATAFLGVPNSVASEWTFILRPRNSGTAAAQADYLVKDLGKKKVGLLCATQAFGTQGCDAAKTAVEAAGGSIVSRQDADIAATNLTTQVLALKNAGAEGVLAFQYPNPVVVFYNQAAENGLNVPIFAGASTQIAIATKNVTAAGLKNAWGIDDCAPATDSRAADFAAKYKAKYGIVPGYAAASAYDSLFIIKQAIEKAGSLDKKAIADALRKTDYKGTCEDYKTDAQQGLHHSSVIESFDSSGLPKVEKRISIPAPS